MAKGAKIPTEYRSGWLDDLDGRTAIAGQMRDRFAALVADAGGPENTSYVLRSLMERALWLELTIAQTERAIAEGAIADVDLGAWVQSLNALSGLYSKIGIKRESKRVAGLHDYQPRTSK